MIAGLNLTPRQTKTALDLFTGAVIVSVAFALAGLTWRIAGHAGTGAITVPSGRSGPAVAPDISQALALAPFGKAAVSDAGQATTLPLVLNGLIAANPARLSTAFISANNQPSAPFHIGDNVGGATIQGIARDRVILSNAGRTEFLAFPDPTLSPEQRATQAQPNLAAPVLAPPAGGPPPGIQAPRPAPPQGQPPAPPPPQAASGAPSAASALQRLDASPTQGGYRIGANGPPGFQPGDVVTSVNGTSLTDPTAASAALTAAQSNGTATLQVVRDGKRLTLTVPLR